MLWFIIFGCDLNLREAFVGEEGSLYVQGVNTSNEDTADEGSEMDTDTASEQGDTADED